MGGVFDPVHNGHIQLALVAMDQVHLDGVIFVPTADPPHKVQPVANFNERASMVELAIEGVDGLDVSLVEANLEMPSYTIDTLKYFFDNILENDEDLYFILGLDAFLDIESWHFFQRVLQLTNLIVVVRVGFDVIAFKTLAEKLGFIQKSSVNWYHVEWKRSIHFIFEPPVEISSTEIRRTVSTDVSFDGYMSKQVVNYIKEHKLYQVQQK